MPASNLPTLFLATVGLLVIAPRVGKSLSLMSQQLSPPEVEKRIWLLVSFLTSTR